MLDNIYMLTDIEICDRIGVKIKTVRLKQNMSQEELADKSGVSISTIKRMEEGEVKTLESLIRILRTLGKLDIFIPLVNEEQLSPNEYYELASKASKPKRQRASKGCTTENQEDSDWWMLLADNSSFNVNISSDTKAAIAEILRLGTSAGGQRAKAIIAFNKETGEIRSGQAEAPDGFDYYIIKLDGVSATAGFKETENFGRLEYSFSRLVKKCGIEMAECSLIEENGRAHFLTKRFDRINGQKVHMQTLCAIAHFDYRLLRAYSYEQAFTVMRGLRLSYKEAQEMFRRMVFNVVVRNQDDHTKNISFLMDRDGKWRLSPAYDMGYAYNPDGQWTSAHQMSINGKFSSITKEDLLECGVKNNIKNAARIIAEVCQAASMWPEIARENEVPQKMIEEIKSNMVFF